MLVVMSMVQMLDEHWTEKLERERITARLGPTLAADLYPTGSWRDRPPITNEAPITAPQQKLREMGLVFGVRWPVPARAHLMVRQQNRG